MGTVRTVLFGLAAIAGTFVVSAIALAVLDIYLTGHGRLSLTQRPFVARGPVQLSVADAIALGVSVSVGSIAMAWHSRHR